jgi:hypothetical protein
MSELAITTPTPLTSLDPIALIRQSDKTDSTKCQYERAVSPYRDAGGNLADVPSVAAYAATLGKSRRAQLRYAVSLWAKATNAIVGDLAHYAHARVGGQHGKSREKS